MEAHGWTLLFHDCIVEQLAKLARAYQAELSKGIAHGANGKTLAAISRLVLQEIPSDPGNRKYRQGGTLGDKYKHWFRAKFFGRFRLFFRYHTGAKTIVYAWVNDESTLRQAGGKNDPYAVFRKMIERGTPPDDWNALAKACAPLPVELHQVFEEKPAGKRTPR